MKRLHKPQRIPSDFDQLATQCLVYTGVIQCQRTRDNIMAGYIVFDIEQRKTSEAGSMRFMEVHIEDTDPWVLLSLISCAIEIGKK